MSRNFVMSKSNSQWTAYCTALESKLTGTTAQGNFGQSESPEDVVSLSAGVGLTMKSRRPLDKQLSCGPPGCPPYR